MHGIVSLLDDQHYRLVENLWSELEQEFGVRGVYITPYPHFSYQIATHYDVATLEPLLQRVAAKSSAFHVRAAGLGIFTAQQPVLYVPVVRSPELTRFHEAIWQATVHTGSGIVEYYHPDNWMPHITIGFGDMNKDNLSQIVRLLAERAFNWEMAVDNIALIYDTGARQELRSRFAFGDGNSNTAQ
jgi:2'-5' RNA ligase superfamily